MGAGAPVVLDVRAGLTSARCPLPDAALDMKRPLPADSMAEAKKRAAAPAPAAPPVQADSEAAAAPSARELAAAQAARARLYGSGTQVLSEQCLPRSAAPQSWTLSHRTWSE